MLAILYLLITLFAGSGVVRMLPLRLRWGEVMSITIIVGLLLGSWISFLASLVFGFTIGLPFSIAILAAVGFLPTLLPKLRNLRYLNEPYSQNRLVWWANAAMAAVVLLLLGVVTWLSFLYPGESGWESRGYVWGDLALHMTLVSSFAYKDAVDMTLPVYSLNDLTYPFLPDFYSAMLKRLGGSWQFVFVAPTLLTLIALMQGVFAFGYRLLGSVRAAWVQLWLLLLAGSAWGGIRFGREFITEGGWSAISRYPQMLANEAGDAYLSILISHLLPQRSYLMGMSIALILLLLWLMLFKRTVVGKNAQAITVASGVLLGLLPMIHVHSFLLMGSFLFVLWVHGIVTQRQRQSMWLWIGLLGLLFALPQLVWQFGGAYTEGFGFFIKGWVMEAWQLDPDGNWFVFWLRNIGVMLPLLVFGPWLLKRYKAPRFLWLMFIFSVVVFVACNLYVFQPNPWDNMKFFTYSLWIQMIIAGWLLAIWSRRWYGALISAGIFVSMTAMGVFSLAHVMTVIDWQLLSYRDIEAGEEMEAALPSDALVLTSDRHNHAVPLLSGRNILVGYQGWLWTYGIDSSDTWRDVKTMYAGGSRALQLINRYEITHVAIDTNERVDFTVNKEFFDQQYPLVYENGNWFLYEVR